MPVLGGLSLVVTAVTLQYPAWREDMIPLANHQCQKAARAMAGPNLINHSTGRRRWEDFRVRLPDEPAAPYLLHHLDDMALQCRTTTRRNNLNSTLPDGKLGREYSDTATLLLHSCTWHCLME